MIEACSSRAATVIRNWAVIVAMCRGGLRAGETLALRPKDVDVTAGTTTVLRGKGDRSRLVGPDPGTMAMLTRCLDTRHGLGINGDAPLLFCALQGRSLQASYVRTLPS